MPKEDVLDKEEDLSFSDLGRIAKATESFRNTILLNIDSAGAGAGAAQHFLLGLAALEQAQRHFKLAELMQADAIVAARKKY